MRRAVLALLLASPACAPAPELAAASPASPARTPATAWTALGDQGGAELGSAVAPAGDVDGDGFADLLVGSAGYDGGEVDEGLVELYLGGPDGLASEPAWRFETDQAGAGFDLFLAAAGDVNGDGYADILLGTPSWDGGDVDEGRAWLFLGGADGLGAEAAWAVESDQAGAWLGAGLAGGGDVDGDGYPDVAVGAPLWDGGEVDEGRVTLYLGAAGGPSGVAAWAYESDLADAEAGAAVAAGDVDGDGFADLVVGVPSFSDPLTNEGRILLFHGSAAGLPATYDWAFETDYHARRLGASVATADVDGDGYADVLAGTPEKNDSTLSIAAYAFLGSAAGLGATPDWLVEGLGVEDGAGGVVASAGDTNGDGYDDVVVGTTEYPIDEWFDPIYYYYWYFPDRYEEGRAWLFLGGPSGPSATPAWYVDLDDVGAQLGYAVAGAGDVDGDGYADVVIGAPGYAVFLAEQGRATLHPGGPAWFTDADGDGYGDPETWHEIPLPGDVSVDGDCDDANAAASPAGIEDCDAADVDEDCDGLADSDDTDATGRTSFFVDGDEDGWGSDETTLSCEREDGQATRSGDCDDAFHAIHPGGQELCDAEDDDENCDGLVDDADPSVTGMVGSWVDADGDLFGDEQVRTCDIPPGNVEIDGDCDDADPAVNPDALERCDAADVDEDCDGVADDTSAVGRATVYADADGDGVGAGTPFEACDPADGTSAADGDCDDGDAAIHPGASEACNGADDDCDGVVDGPICAEAPDAADPSPPAKGGCGCATSGAGSGWLGVLALLAVRTSRRRSGTGISPA